MSLAVAACSAPPPVAYTAPAPGTVYDYGGFKNTITAVDGWRTAYVDDRGRQAGRIALFITEDPAHPLTVESAALDSLWPLRVGDSTAVRVGSGEEVYWWHFRVLDRTAVTVPAGTYDAVVVEGLQLPELVHSPEDASSVLHTWWYAPEVEGVVRFESTYLTGPGKGRQFSGELRSVTRPPDGAGGDGERTVVPAAGRQPDPVEGPSQRPR